MDNNFSEKIEELLRKCQRLSSEAEALRAEIEELKALQAAPVVEEEPAYMPVADDEEPIDIDITIEEDDVAVAVEGDFSTTATPPVEMTGSQEEPVTLSEAEGSQEGPVTLSEAEGSQDEPEAMPESLFGDAPAPIEDTGKSRRRAPRALYQTASAPKAVIDAMAAKAAWRIDMPGPEVRSLRSAIALGDQVIFINRLFRKDSALYQTTIDTLNETASLSDAINYLSETFPEWDLESEDVYRFMMAVRRKIRK